MLACTNIEGLGPAPWRMDRVPSEIARNNAVCTWVHARDRFRRVKLSSAVPTV